jgi:hypothetical protein
MKVMLTNSPIDRGDFTRTNTRASTGLFYLGSMLGKQPDLSLEHLAGTVIEDVNLAESKNALFPSISEHDPAMIGMTVYEIRSF